MALSACIPAFNNSRAFFTASFTLVTTSSWGRGSHWGDGEGRGREEGMGRGGGREEGEGEGGRSIIHGQMCMHIIVAKSLTAHAGILKAELM